MTGKSTSDFEHLLERIDKSIPFLAMNPLNESSEKRRFMKDRSYSPRFRYREHGCSCSELMRKIERIRLDDSIINNLLKEKLEKFSKSIMMNKAIGSSDFSRCSKAIFGEPSKALIKRSKIFINHRRRREHEHIDSEETAKRVNSIISGLRLSGWNVSEKSMVAKAAVRASEKKIYIKKGSLFCDDFIRRIVAHEIGTHVFRSENGRRQPYKLFVIGFPDYLMTEEGLAVNCEEKAGCSMAKTLKDYAGRVVAVDLALQGSFRDVFEGLKEFFDDEDSWGMALRAKRGMGNTSRPGAYTKDYVYLEGYSRVKAFLDYKGSKGMKKLYFGKIGLEHVKLLDKIDGLVEPTFVPRKRFFTRQFL